MNATILVAIAVTISSIVRRDMETARRLRLALFVAQLSVVFLGMVASGFGLLLFNVAAPFDSSSFMALARLVFVPWIVGFQLHVVGIRVSTRPDLPGPGGQPPWTGRSRGNPAKAF